jgi:hypothetical protein
MVEIPKCARCLPQQRRPKGAAARSRPRRTVGLVDATVALASVLVQQGLLIGD